MAKGGFRPNAGRPRGSRDKSPRRRKADRTLLIGGASIPADIVEEARKSGMSPLDFMLSVMNDAAADPYRRDRMAIAAAPFVHAKAHPSVRHEENDDDI